MKKFNLFQAMKTKRNVYIQVVAMLLAFTMCMGTFFTLEVSAEPEEETQVTETEAEAETDTETDAETDADVKDILEKTEPKLMLESYKITNGYATKGNKFVMKVNVKNTNKYADAYNILITYTSDSDNVRLVDEKTNQHFEEVIRAGETISYDLEFEVLDYYEMDTMIMNFTFSYLDKYGDGYTTSSMITPKVNKNCILKVNSLAVADHAIVGAKSLVNVRYSSEGTLPIQSVKMIVTGDILDGRKVFDLEGVSENEQKTFDSYVNFSKDGEQKIVINFEYTDENGNVYTSDPQQYTVNVSSYEAAKVSVGQTDSSSFITEENRVYIVVGCVAVLVILVLLVGIFAAKSKEKRGNE